MVQVRLGSGRSRRSKMRESKASLAKSIRPIELSPRWSLPREDIYLSGQRYREVQEVSRGAREEVRVEARYILRTPPSPCTKYVGRLTIG